MLGVFNERNKLDIEKLFQLCSTLLDSVINYTQKKNVPKIDVFTAVVRFYI